MTALTTTELSPDPGSLSALASSGAAVRRRSGERGQGMVEYALILILIAIGVLIAIQVLGSGTTSLYSNIESGVHIATGG